jgi:hypothetical protein
VAEDEMGCTCGMYREDEKWMQGYDGELWREETRRETIIRGNLEKWNWRWQNGLTFWHRSFAFKF